jgi:hypothetical protein
MSEMELIRYNRTVPYLDEVYCSEEMSIGSHIRERSCGTKRDIIEGRTGSLGNPSSSISVARKSNRPSKMPSTIKTSGNAKPVSATA